MSSKTNLTWYDMIGNMIILMSMLENIVKPDSINILLLAFVIKCSKAFDCIILETPTKFVPIPHVKSTKTFLMVHTEFSLIKIPI